MGKEPRGREWGADNEMVMISLVDKDRTRKQSKSLEAKNLPPPQRAHFHQAQAHHSRQWVHNSSSASLHSKEKRFPKPFCSASRSGTQNRERRTKPQPALASHTFFLPYLLLASVMPTCSSHTHAAWSKPVLSRLMGQSCTHSPPPQTRRTGRSREPFAVEEATPPPLATTTSIYLFLPPHTHAPLRPAHVHRTFFAAPVCDLLRLCPHVFAQDELAPGNRPSGSQGTDCNA